MNRIGYRVRLLTVAFAAIFLSPFISNGDAHAAPQIIAAVPTGGDVELICAEGTCSAEFSTICLQQSRTKPSPLTPYILHGPDQDAMIVTGHSKDNKTASLAPGVLRFVSLRGHSAFRVSAPEKLLKSQGLARMTVKIDRLAMLLPVPEEGDTDPQTAADKEKAFHEIKSKGGYWTEMDPDNLAMARVTNRIINLLPAKGSVTTAAGEALWRQAAAPERELSKESLAINRSYFDYCRENGLTPGGFAMRRCLGDAHDWFMKDLNVNYWKSLKPTS